MAQLVLKNILAGSGNVLAGGDNTGNVTKVTIGANLTLSGGVLSASGGGTGSVTSVALTRSGNALTITGSPITTAGTINIGFAGTTAQYIRGDGTLATFPTITGYVPYTGATQNLDLGTYGLLADFVGFNTAPTSIPTTQGTLSWNVDKESLDLIMNGTTGSLMQDSFYNVKNQTGVTIPKGTVVRANGTVGASGRILIAPFLADGTYSSKYCMGVTAEAIADGADGKVLAFGALRKIDTSAYTNGTILYASPTTAGAFTTTEPSNPNNIVTLAIVVYSDNTNGEIFVRPTFIPSQAELILSLGYTPANDANVVKLTGNQTVGGVKTFSAESIFSNGITLTGGDLVLKSGTYTNTINTDTLTANRSILFPDNSGTVALTSDIVYPVTSVFGRTGDVVAVSGDYNTDQVTEGTTNLYYTNARARGAMSANVGSALTYDSATGRYTLLAADSGTSGYLTAADWTDFDSKQASLGTGTTSQFLRGDLVWAAPPTPALEDLTDVGITSPTNGQLLRYQVGTWVNWTPNYVSATYFSATAPLSYNSGTGVFSISQATTSTNGYLSSTDWNTFNNKQNALTNPVTGTGATGYIAKWNTASTITNSLIYEASSKVGINTTNMVSLFDVTKNALGVTVVDTSGITLKNETEAITGNQQISPALHFKSNGWNNLATASQSADWINYSLPIQGNAVTSNLLWASSINGAAYTTRFTLSSAGNGTFTGTLAASNLSGTNTGDVTIGTANGLSLSGQAISLALASTSTTGALSSTDWNTFNGKQAQINGTGFVKASGTTISYDNTSYLPITGGTLTGDLTINYTTSWNAVTTNNGGGITTPQGAFFVNTYPTTSDRYYAQFSGNWASAGTWGLGVRGSSDNSIYLARNNSGVLDITASVNLYIGPGLALHTSNYSSYALPLSGGTLTGTLNGTVGSFSSTMTASSFARIGGTSSQFLKGDGSVDTNTYVTGGPYLPLSGGTLSGVLYGNGGGNFYIYNYGRIGLPNAGRIIYNNGTGSNMFFGEITNDVYGFTNNLYTDIPTLAMNVSSRKVTINGSSPTGQLTIQALADGNMFSIRGSIAGYSYPNIIEMGQSGADGYINVKDGAGNIQSSISGYSGTATYFKSKLGVGTTTPVDLFEIYSGTYLKIKSFFSSPYTSGFAFSDYNGGIKYDAGNDRLVLFANYPSTAAAEIVFEVANAEAARIAGNGNTLIGTTTDSGYKLNVNGTGYYSSVLTTAGGINFATTVRCRWGGNNTPALGFPFGGSDTGNALFIEAADGDSGGVAICNDGVTVYGAGDTGFVFRAIDEDVYQATSDVSASTNFYVYQGQNGGAYFRGSVTVNSGNVTASAFFESSDKRLKKEISNNPIIENISTIKPKLYIKDGKEEFGYYAQELEEILPSSVSEGKDGFLTLSYSQVHTAKIAKLEAELVELKEIVKTLINELGRNK